MVRQRQQRVDRQFSDEEVGEIIRLASRLDDAAMGPSSRGLSLSDVNRIAGELGIAEASILEAVAAYEADRRRSRRRHRVRTMWLKVLQAHALVYGTAVVGIGGLDLATGNGFDIVQYPAFGWGVLLAWHAGLTWLFGRESHRPTDRRLSQ